MKCFTYLDIQSLSYISLATCRLFSLITFFRFAASIAEDPNLPDKLHVKFHTTKITYQTVKSDRRYMKLSSIFHYSCNHSYSKLSELETPVSPKLSRNFIVLKGLIQKLDEITVHSFIARAQSAYSNNLKETIISDVATVLGGFAENYSLIIQDKVQGYHWNKSQCSLHPIVIYHRSENALVQTSICILLDDLTHDVCFVYKVMMAAIEFI